MNLYPLIATLLWLIDNLLWLYEIIVIAAVVMSWLVAFGVVNQYNQFARSVIRFLYAATDPVFRQIRRIIPTIGGWDLSPIIVLLVIQVIRMLMYGYLGMYMR
ncbi:MAG TPA: YggT family protein [Rhizomicrobium sp.]